MLKARYYHSIILAAAVLAASAMAQDTERSPVLRDPYTPARYYYINPLPGIGKQLRDFQLLQEANRGDSEAQNTLGIKYLLGDGFAADTAKAAYWIEKAAAQRNYSGLYNRGLLRTKGWGVPWDPYAAVEDFRVAAVNGLPEAQFAYGIVYTDDLIFRRDWETAAHWIAKAREQGLTAADEVLTSMLERGHISPADTVLHDVPEDSPSVAFEPPKQEEYESASPDGWSPVFLDFEEQDETAEISTGTLLAEAVRTSGLAEGDSAALAARIAGKPAPGSDSALARILEAVAAGNPEATVFYGRLAETGAWGRREADPLYALQEYIHALFLESRRAPALVNAMMEKNAIRSKLRFDENIRTDRTAMYIRAGLAMLQFDSTIGGRNIQEMLVRSGEMGNVRAVLLLGIAYQRGTWVEQDIETALKIWGQAAENEHMEATVRIAAVNLLTGAPEDSYFWEIDLLRKAMQRGSLIAEVALAYAYQSGTGVVRSMAKALEMYRDAAMRGSSTAYGELKRLYEAKKPEEWE
ncbi:MAG: hypothetical protein CL946_04180 [Ectothiorhodospiraceae bacterium]|nr:hypothetical protein [Ectothiorhodospiraceae bacterium]